MKIFKIPSLKTQILIIILDVIEPILETRESAITITTNLKKLSLDHPYGLESLRTLKNSTFFYECIIHIWTSFFYLLFLCNFNLFKETSNVIHKDDYLSRLLVYIHSSNLLELKCQWVLFVRNKIVIFWSFLNKNSGGSKTNVQIYI